MATPHALTRPLAALRHHAGRALLLAAVLSLLVLGARRLLLGPEVPVMEVVQRDFVQTVVASGRVETPHRVELSAQVTGTVVRIPVAEGQSVGAGTVLVELDSAESRAAVNQAELAVKQAQARLRQLREVQAPVARQVLSQAQANHEALRQALERSRELFNRNFIGQAALDEAARAERVARAQVLTAELQLASLHQAGSDAALAEASLAQAQAAADAARARLRYTTIAAPVAGTLIARNIETGDVVQPGKVLMVLSPAGETQLVVQIDEKNLGLLREGLPALASADAYPSERFACELVYINPAVDAQRGAVEVKLHVPALPSYLRQDMTVSVDIEVARRQRAVLVPSEALHEADTAHPWVLKVVDGRLRQQAVRLGLRSSGLAEVLDGLLAGDRVTPAAGAAATQWTDGTRVRPVAFSVAK
ncbi:MAG: efflux transporter periplasmic adaptor subunit [Burkholderiales bacterium PBB1]|nr:MAG: efflux transporter periplasmic adaptor subunit [Burkholderiales bacterium PBB1]